MQSQISEAVHLEVENPTEIAPVTDQIFKFPFRTLPLEKFCALTGYTPGAIRQKICRAEWAEAAEYCKDPAGRIHVILEGYDRWVASGVASRHEVAA